MLLPEDITFCKLWNGKTHIFLCEDGLEQIWQGGTWDKGVRIPADPQYLPGKRMKVTTLCGMQGFLRKRLDGTAADGAPGGMSRRSSFARNNIQLLDCDRCNIVLVALRKSWGM